jgi:hypothetical protein
MLEEKMSEEKMLEEKISKVLLMQLQRLVAILSLPLRK